MRCSNSGRFGRPVSESWKASSRKWPSRDAAAAGAVEQREQGGDQPTTSASMTATVPIQDMRSLRVGEGAVVGRGAVQVAAQARRTGARPARATFAARSKSRLRMQRELVADDRAQRDEGLERAPDGASPPASAARRARDWMRSGDGLALGLDAERDAALGGRLPLAAR